MVITFEHLGRKYRADLSRGTDLSSTMGNKTKELSAWYVPPVQKEPVQMGDWVGSVKAGAPVNFYNIQFNPHGNGTHTEGYGHISKNQEDVNQALTHHHYLAYLVDLSPIEKNGDMVITLRELEEKIKKWNFEALIVRSGNYGDGHNFSSTNPAYFEPVLLKFVRERGVQHFLTDLPSVDREEDGGALAAHKAFWDFPANPRASATISELLQIPAEIKEGYFLLNLQMAHFENDACPSRPVIYRADMI